MNLILELTSPPPSPASVRRKVFGTNGGRIGRAVDCDWVLASPYISRHHATVRFAEGTFYIESTGENGVAMNSPSAMLPQLERRALKNGDRLFIDDLEIQVVLAESAASLGLGDGAFGGAGSLGASGSALGGTGAFGASGAGLGGTGAFGASGAGLGGSGAFGASGSALGGTGAFGASSSALGPVPGTLGASGAALDPLLNLPGGRSAAPTAPEVPWNASSSLADHFTPPRMTPRALPVAEDWDDTGLDRTPVRSKAPLQVVPSARDSVAPGAPGGATPAALAAPPAPAAPAATVTAPPLGRSATSPSLGSGAGSLALGGGAGSPAFGTSASSPSLGQSTHSRSAETFDISPLLHALGVDPSTLAPGAHETLAVSVRSVLQGLIDVLRARAEFRNQFRLQDTRITLTENNPLKFAINAQDALGSLFGDPNPGYLRAADAFDDAFDDMRRHQLATLAGMRAGFESLLARFDPEVLQQRFDRHLKRAGFLSVGAKLRYWDLYTEIFEDLSADRNGAFQRLFGEAFAAAYEKQLEAAQKGPR